MRFAVRPSLQDGDVGIIGTYVLVVAAVVGVAGDGRLVLAAREVEDGAALGVRDLVGLSCLDGHADDGRRVCVVVIKQYKEQKREERSEERVDSDASKDGYIYSALSGG